MNLTPEMLERLRVRAGDSYLPEDLRPEDGRGCFICAAILIEAEAVGGRIEAWTHETSLGPWRLTEETQVRHLRAEGVL